MQGKICVFSIQTTFSSFLRIHSTLCLEPAAQVVLSDGGLRLEYGERDGSLGDGSAVRLTADDEPAGQAGVLHHLHTANSSRTLFKQKS